MIINSRFSHTILKALPVRTALLLLFTILATGCGGSVGTEHEAELPVTPAPDGNDGSNDDNDSDYDGPDYGFHDGSGTYTQNPRPQPLPVIDSDFYTEPVSFNVTRNLVTDYQVNNTDMGDDTAVLQQALDQISAEFNGGKLVIPAGDYYLRSLHLRSNVHLEIDEGATFYMAAGGGYNVWMFEMGNGSQGKA
ncbi:hypothetical protein, partial [Thalassotalea mangrovi]